MQHTWRFRTPIHLVMFVGFLTVVAPHDTFADTSAFSGRTAFHQKALAGLSGGKPFTLEHVPVQGRSVTLEFSTTRLKAKRYRSEVVHPGLAAQPLRQRPIHLFTADVIRADGTRNPGDFAKVSFQFPRRVVDGLMRVDGVLYGLSSERRQGMIHLVVAEIPEDELRGLVFDAVHAAGAHADDERAAGAGADSASGLKEVEMGTAADAEFVALFGSAAEANNHIISIVHGVNGIYERDLGLTNTIVIQRAFSGTDPYTTTNGLELLAQFRSEWTNNVSQQYDVAHLFSGLHRFSDGPVGWAYYGACTGHAINAYHNQSDSLLKVVVSHEEGHNFNAPHSTTGGIMNATVSSSLTSFSAESIQQITQYANGLSCLTHVATGGPPTLDHIPAQSIQETQTLNVTLTASDPDGDALTFSASPLPSGASISHDGHFTYTPPLTTAGCNMTKDVTIEFSVSDGNGNSDSQSVVVSVQDQPNQMPPVLTHPGNRTVNVGSTLHMTLAASDADGDPLTFNSSSLPAGATLSNAGVLTWTPESHQLGHHVVTVSVTDCYGNAAQQTFTIIVEDAAIPIISALSPVEGPANTVVTIDGEHFANDAVVYFGEKVGSLQSATATRLTVKAPRQHKRTAAAVPVTVRQGGATSNAVTFTYVKGRKGKRK